MHARCIRLILAGPILIPASHRPLSRTQIEGKQQLAASVLGRDATTKPESTTFIDCSFKLNGAIT
jgi:hypothetical protein